MQLLQRIDTEFGAVMEIKDLFTLLTLESQIEWVTANSGGLSTADDNLLATASETDDDRVELEL